MKRQPTNINWNCEEILNTEPESTINDNWTVSFDYNGYNVNAICNIYIQLEKSTEIGGSGVYGGEDCETITSYNVTEVDLELIEMFYNYGDDFKVDLKEFYDIQEFLKNDLDIQF